MLWKKKIYIINYLIWQSIHGDKSMLNTIKINKKHSDKNVFLNINKEITKIIL